MMKRAAAVAALAVCPWLAFAQQSMTVGELLSKGGKRLGGEELTKLVSGSEVSGVSATNPNTTFEASYKRDGTLEGSIFAARRIYLWGKWSVSERGEICTDFQTQSSAVPVRVCAPYFELGGKYYQAKDAENSQQVYHREIKR